MLPQDWQERSVGACLTQVRAKGKPLKTNQYGASGLYPIIDQGQRPIAGWTNNKLAVIDTPLPLVIFGDHTRQFKYVDRPFARGADGTQLLHPGPDFDVGFFYFACRALDIPSRGYNRHFGALKELSIPIPPLNEQRQIASVLWMADEAVQLSSAIMSRLLTLRSVALAELLSRGLRNDELAETEIGLIPRSWEVVPLEEIARIYSSSRLTYSELLARDDERRAGDIRILGVKVADMNRPGSERVLENCELERWMSPDEAEDRCIPAGAIVFPKNGAAVATNKKRLVSAPCVLDPNVMALQVSAQLSQQYLFHWLSRFDLASILKPGPVPSFGKGDIASVLVPVPSQEEQQRIVDVLAAIDLRIDLQREKHAALEALLKSLLSRLMAGELRLAGDKVLASSEAA